MKTQISRHSHQPHKRYSGVYQQQGRMITDADWNELVTIINERISLALRDVVGEGTPAARALGGTLEGDLYFSPGTAHADGLVAENRVRTGFHSQEDFPAAPGAPVKDDIVYVDVWERPVLFLEDPRLRDPGLHGADTGTRMQTMLQFKYCKPGVQLTNPDVNPMCGDAPLTLRLRAARPDAPAAEAQASGNFVFRLEVHDVQGPAKNPTELTLKWSTENASEVYANDDRVPADFKGNDWLYEFYSDTSEKHLGVHHVTAPGFPARGILEVGYPVTPPAKETWPYVRRWDGTCKLSRNSTTGVWTLLPGGRDRGAPLTVRETAERHGDAQMAGGLVKILLQELDLSLSLVASGTASRTFVAGDYWLTTVRQDDDAGAVLLDTARPVGIVHHYVKLGLMDATSLLSDPGVKFPSLTGLRSSEAGKAGASFIGASGFTGAPRSLTAGTVQSQLVELVTHLNNHVLATSPDHDNRYYTKTESDGRYYAKTESDSRYYTKTESDGRYYTKTESDSRLTTGLSSLNATNLTSGTVPAARLSGAYPNITGVGTLTGLKLSGDADFGGNLVKGMTLGVAAHTVTYANTLDVMSNGMVTKREGWLSIATTGSPSSFVDVRNANGSVVTGLPIKGSFLAFSAGFSGLHSTGHTAYIVNGGPTGSGQASGGYGFRAVNTGTGQVTLHAVTFGMGAPTGYPIQQSALIDAAVPVTPRRYLAVHRGDNIEYYVNGTLACTVSTAGMATAPYPAYTVRLETGASSTPPTSLEVVFLSIGVPFI